MTKNEKAKLQDVKNFLDYSALVFDVMASVFADKVEQRQYFKRREAQCIRNSRILYSLIKGAKK